ncbi:PepSY-associated TM helix domain-containing protein [Solimonas marina]|nr:PepSY domain-containing protein [Solimonas marina]
MQTTASERRAARYRAVWRWHFYAGLFCIPFVIWLATTGSIYLFKPQIDALLERRYDHLQIDGPLAPPSAQVAAALATQPGSVLNAYELPAMPSAAARVLIGHGSVITRVFVNPQTLQVLGSVPDEQRFTRLIFRLHGELLLGARGSLLVELAASWAIIMIVSGLFLWWPRQAQGAAGVLYPRLRRGGRVFWRDLHAVVGLWVSAFALFLLSSGLPWATFWGHNLQTVRSMFGPSTPMQQDWSTGTADDLALAAAQNTPAPTAHQDGMPMKDMKMSGMKMSGMKMPATPDDAPSSMPGMTAAEMAAMPGQGNTGPFDAAALDRLVPVIAALHLPPPALIAPPSKAAPTWTARSDTQDRPQRVSLVLDGDAGRVVSRTDFDQRPMLDRIIGTGVAAHEGQLFGWPNQLLGLLTALGLMTLCVSALMMWWKRRPDGTLGAPLAVSGSTPRLVAFVAVAVLLGILLPAMGISLVAVLLVERLVLRRIAPARAFLGLRA